MIDCATHSGCNSYYAVKHRLLSACAAKREAKASRLPKGTMAWAKAMAKVTEAYWALRRLEDALQPSRN